MTSRLICGVVDNSSFPSELPTSSTDATAAVALLPYKEVVLIR
jgi:hypothetical protein